MPVSSVVSCLAGCLARLVCLVSGVRCVLGCLTCTSVRTYLAMYPPTWKRRCGCGCRGPCPFILALVINHPPSLPPTLPASPQTVKALNLFFPLSHPTTSSTFIRPDHYFSPPPSPFNLLPPFDLTCHPAESSHVHLRPTSTTAKLTFVSSKSGIPVLAQPSSSPSPDHIAIFFFSLSVSAACSVIQPGTGGRKRTHSSRSETAN